MSNGVQKCIHYIQLNNSPMGSLGSGYSKELVLKRLIGILKSSPGMKGKLTDWNLSRLKKSLKGLLDY